jgi:acyl phosphate:glycerol-3-phosphate acyltransferase
MIDAIILLLAYLLGSIPSGIILTKLAGIKDLQKKGSGNIGTTNVMRVAGKKIAFLTLLFDAVKGVLAVMAAEQFCVNIYLAAALSVIGHIHSIWLRFKGGKGVATTIAVLTYLNWTIGVFIGSLWLTVFYASRISSLSAIIATSMAPIFTYYTAENAQLFYLNLFLSAIVILKHKTNIAKLLKGEERKIIK